MEKIILLKTEEDVYSIFKKIQYGSVSIKYDNEEIHKISLKCIDLLNALMGEICCYEGIYKVDNIVATEGKNSDFEESVVKDAYRIYYTIRNKASVFDEKHMELFSCASSAAEKGVFVSLSPAKELIKLAKKIAIENGVRFINSTTGIGFDGRPKTNIFTELESAFIEGNSFIEFDTDRYNHNTMRAYCATLQAKTGVKVRCSINEKRIRISFGEPSKEEAFAVSFNELINEYPGLDITGMVYNFLDIQKIASEHITKNPVSAIELALEEMTWTSGISTEEYALIMNIIKPPEAPQWQILGFDSLQAYQDDIARKKADLEDWENSEPDPVQAIPSRVTITGTSKNDAIPGPGNTFAGDDQDPRVETVDGLQQFVIPGMSSAHQEPENNFRYLGEVDLAYPETPLKGMPEDEDF